ncbi:MAG: alpha/beta fold hydrolase [Pseudomonadota bacterium]|nr:alpha/beta fold hydrolase [Pseudomonadota bacterium]
MERVEPGAKPQHDQYHWRPFLGATGSYDRRGPDAVLLIHGLTGTPAEMRHLAMRLRKRGFSVMVPQLAGHCGSIADLKRSRWQDWYAGVERAFDALAGHHQRVFVAGLSMGALLALELAARRGAQVAGLGLLSPTFFYDGWNMPRFRRRLLPLAFLPPLKQLLYWRETPPYGIKCERTRAMVHAVLANRDAQASEKVGIFRTPMATVHQSSLLIRHVSASLARVQSPLLVVHSTEDDMASVRNAHFVTERVASTDVETWLIDDTYHVLTLDRRKDDVADRLGEFFGLRARPALVA